MNTKTLDNTANDPWADIATASTTYATPDTSPPPDTRHRSPRPESTLGRRPSDRLGMAGPGGPCPPLTDQQDVNAIIITIIAIF